MLNALHLDPYLWNLQVGRERLVQRARAAGAPINGVTISAGIPDKAEALALLDELAAAGIWLNAFKPGTVAQVQEVLAIAADTPHTLWIHLEGGAAGGHHSWEDLDELLLSTYHLIREHENVVLAVGGGIADPERAGALLTGTWAHAHGAATMPVDADPARARSPWPRASRPPPRRSRPPWRLLPGTTAGSPAARSPAGPPRAAPA